MRAMYFELLPFIKQRDYDRYLCALLAPSKRQASLVALLAFNAEIAPVAEVTSEAAIGAIRLKWWEEALDEIYGAGSVREHQVVQALQQAVHAHDLPRELFDRAIQARFLDLESKQGFEDEVSFVNYLDNTAGCLHELMAMVCDARAAIAAREEIMKMARCYAEVGLLRALPYHVERGLIRWPRDILQQHGVSPAAIANDTERECVALFVAYWVDQVLAEDVASLPRSLRPLTLMHRVALAYAKQLKFVAYDLSKMPVRLPMLPVALWWWSLVG